MNRIVEYVDSADDSIQYAINTIYNNFAGRLKSGGDILLKLIISNVGNETRVEVRNFDNNINNKYFNSVITKSFLTEDDEHLQKKYLNELINVIKCDALLCIAPMWWDNVKFIEIKEQADGKVE